MSTNDPTVPPPKPKRRPEVPGIPATRLPQPSRPEIGQPSDPAPAIVQRRLREENDALRRALEQANRSPSPVPAERPIAAPYVPAVAPAAPDPNAHPALRLKPWAALAVSILLAVGGGAGGVGIDRASKPDPARSDQLEALDDRVDQLEDEARENREFNRRRARSDERRWNLQNAFNCIFNGSSWIRGIDCDEVKFETAPLGAEWAGPKIKAHDAEWPRAPKPP